MHYTCWPEGWAHVAMSRTSFILVLLAIPWLVSGCVPIPKKAVVRYGVQGILVDAATGATLAKNHVFVTSDGNQFKAKTNGKGEFKVRPEMHHFWTWLGGPMWRDATRVTVDISLDGYIPYRKTFIVKTESPEAQVPSDQACLFGVSGRLKPASGGRFKTSQS